MKGLVYPRLPDTAATRLIEDLRIASTKGLEDVQLYVAMSHPKAAPVPTGGQIATEIDIARVREEVTEAVGGWIVGRAVPRVQVAEFDRALAKSLHDSLRILPADATHPEVWNFLTLVVLLDVAITRFPQMHQSRMLGVPRNALRRAWSRYKVLGDLLTEGPSTIG